MRIQRDRLTTATASDGVAKIARESGVDNEPQAGQAVEACRSGRFITNAPALRQDRMAMSAMIRDRKPARDSRCRFLRRRRSFYGNPRVSR